MPALPTNLVKIGSVYKFRARIPQDLLRHYHPKREVTESLGTKSLKEARRLLPAIQLKYQMEWANRRSATTSNYTDLALNDASIQYLTTFFEHESLAGDERTRLAGHYTIEEIEEYREGLADAITYLRDVAAIGNVDAIKPALDQYLDLKHIRVTGGEDDYRRLALAYVRGAIKTNTALLARMNGETVPTPSAGELEAISADDGVNMASTARHQAKGPTLYSLFEYWRDAIPGRPQRTVNDFERCVRDVDAVTQHKPAEALTKADIVQYRDALLAKGKSPNTVEKDLSFIKTILHYACESVKLKHNPADTVRVAKPKVSRNTKRALGMDDLRRLFGSSVYVEQQRPVGGGRDAAAWLPLLGLYTGARLEELSQLRVVDIQKRSGIHYLDILDVEDHAEGISTHVKTVESRRQMPIHDDLIRAGFLAYVAHVQAQGHDWLFPHLVPDRYGKRSGNWSKWWSRWRAGLGVGGRHQVFHSLRHNFKTACRDAEISEEIHDALTGHVGGGVSRDYGEVSLKAMAAAMKKLELLDFTFDWVWQASTDAWARKPIPTRKTAKSRTALKPRKAQGKV